MDDKTSTELTVEWVPTDQLSINPSNPRVNDRAVEHVAASIRRFGWRQPLVARPSGIVIAGNTRLKAARLLGHERVPVVRFEGTDLEATAYAIADNNTHDYSSWDEPVLAKLLEELRAEDSLEGTGFSDQDIDSLIAELEAQQGPVELDDPGPEEPPAIPVTRMGNLWRLGNHRLLCGDSTKATDLERLMGGKRAALLSTDPPYCVDYDGNSRPIHDGKSSGKDWSHVYREVEIEDLGEFLDGALTACLPRVPGFNNPVDALTVFDDGSGPALYAGGSFTGIRGQYISKWNGSSWSKMSLQVNFPVYAFAVFDDGSGSALFVGGNFTRAGGIRSIGIARWNGSSWSGMNDSFTSWTSIRSLAVFDDGSGPALYAGGEHFSVAGGVAVSSIARWDGSSWSSPGSGVSPVWVSGASVDALAVFNAGNGQALYAGHESVSMPDSGDSYLGRWARPPSVLQSKVRRR